MLQEEDGRAILTLTAGESAVFGYGSLLSKASLEQTLGRDYLGPFLPCILRNWRRRWNVAMPNTAFYFTTGAIRSYPQYICYLNIEPVEGVLLNGTLFKVSNAELEALDRREWIYERRDISSDLVGMEVQGGRAHTYVARPDFHVELVSSVDRVAIRSSYLQLLRDGLEDLGPDFVRAYEASSEPVPQTFVIDDHRDPQAASPFLGPPKR